MTTLPCPALGSRPDAPSAQQQAPPPAAWSRPEIAKALAAAQAACKPAEKDSYNEYHHYHYASAEAIITEARSALAAAGLSLVPLEQTLQGSQKEGEDRFELERKFLLLHASGECLPIVSHWPVVPENGRPLDKATAIAATLSLAYLLRDLCLIPRVSPDEDLPAREDRPRQAGAAKSQPAPPQAPERPAAGLEARKARDRRIRPLMARCRYSWADVCQYLGKPATTGLSELSEAEFNAVCATMEAQAAEAAPAKK